MSYFGGGSSGFNNFGLPDLGGNFNLGNTVHVFTGLVYDALYSGFYLWNSAQGFMGLGYGGLNSAFNLGNNANHFDFANTFGGANPQITPRQPGCPAGCFRPMPGEPCVQGSCPDGCCQMS